MPQHQTGRSLSRRRLYRSKPPGPPRKPSTGAGITGLWQVLGRSDIPFSEMVTLDYLYVNNWSLWGDFKLLIRTISVVVHRRGAY